MSKYKILGIEEVVIAVNNVDKAAKLFEELFGFNFKYEWILHNEKIRVKSSKLGETQLQFMEPISNDSVVRRFLDKHGEGLNHIAFKVEGLDELVNKLKGRGLKLIPDKPIEITDPRNKNRRIRYIFIHPKSIYGVLIELIEYI